MNPVKSPIAAARDMDPENAIQERFSVVGWVVFFSCLAWIWISFHGLRLINYFRHGTDKEGQSSRPSRKLLTGPGSTDRGGAFQPRMDTDKHG